MALLPQKNTGSPAFDSVPVLILVSYEMTSWWRGTVVERRSLTGELSLSFARPAADV